jgi:hypothetical protein
LNAKSAIGIMFVLIIISLASVSMVGAQQVPPPYGFVFTTTASGAYSINFIVGQQVHINWMAGSTNTVNIYVTYQTETGAIFPLANDDGIDVPQTSLNGIIYFVPDQPGYYYIHLMGAYGGDTTYQISTAQVLVAPESVFGALSAIGAGVAAFGTVAIVKKRKQTSFSPF